MTAPRQSFIPIYDTMALWQRIANIVHIVVLQLHLFCGGDCGRMVKSGSRLFGSSAGSLAWQGLEVCVLALVQAYSPLLEQSNTPIPSFHYSRCRKMFESYWPLIFLNISVLLTKIKSYFYFFIFFNFFKNAHTDSKYYILLESISFHSYITRYVSIKPCQSSTSHFNFVFAVKIM